MWLTSPYVEVGRALAEDYASNAETNRRERMDRLNGLIREAGRLRQEDMRVVELAERLGREPGGELDPALRPDGAHFLRAPTLALTEAWLGELVMDAYRELRPDRAAAR